ncbi:MAG: flagellar biosynthesis protein FliQ [Hydrogenophilales bacterium]|nr:flagellar biosynthesis protein FliQ [Hydrogenophilales bacterium]
MTPETVVTIGQQALQMTILVASPLMLAGLVTGLLVSIFQAATSINEMTLTFIPKLIVIFIVLILAGPWMIDTMTSYMRELFSNIPQLIR